MLFRAIICLFVFSSLSACNNEFREDKENKLAQDIAGPWVEKSSSITPDGDVNGFRVSSEGEITNISVLPENEYKVADLNDEGQLELTENGLADFNETQTRGVEFDSVSLLIEQNGSKEIVVYMTGAVTDGEVQDVSKLELYSMLRTTEQEIANLKTKLTKP